MAEVGAWSERGTKRSMPDIGDCVAAFVAVAAADEAVAAADEAVVAADIVGKIGWGQRYSTGRRTTMKPTTTTTSAASG